MVGFQASEQWRAAYPGAAAGVLALSGAPNGPAGEEFAAARAAVEQEIRDRFSDREAIKADPVIAAYRDYYKRFRKTYHVLLQVESVAVKGKGIPPVGVLVEAMFMAELRNRLLTSGHDAALLAGPIQLDVATGSEVLYGMNGRETELKPGDMFMTDGQGVLSAVIYGGDERTRIHQGTNSVAYTVYAPPGVGASAVESHLADIESYVRLAHPQARRELLKVERA